MSQGFFQTFLTGGIAIEFAALFLACAVGSSVFDKFEVETPIWKKLLRWSCAAFLTILTYLFVGHWALLVFGLLSGLGLAVHVNWCRKHGIDPIAAHPREAYYRLRNWPWPPSQRH